MHKTIDSYFGIEKPEEKSCLKSGSNPVVLVNSLFSVWAEYLTKNFQPHDNSWPDDRMLDPLLHEAEKIVSTHRLPKQIMNREFFLLISTLGSGYRTYAGIFYTALLNCSTRYMLVPAGVPFAGLWGYQLKNGVLEFSTEGEHIGSCAKGGCIVNNSPNIVGPFENHLGVTKLQELGTFGRRAKAGVFINNRSVALFGTQASGGIYINNGYVDTAGDQSENSIYINHGVMERFGDYGNSILINFGSIEKILMEEGSIVDVNKVYSVTKRDDPLRKLLDSLYDSTTGLINEEKVRSIVRDIGLHAI